MCLKTSRIGTDEGRSRSNQGKPFSATFLNAAERSCPPPSRIDGPTRKQGYWRHGTASSRGPRNEGYVVAQLLDRAPADALGSAAMKVTEIQSQGHVDH